MHIFSSTFKKLRFKKRVLKSNREKEMERKREALSSDYKDLSRRDEARPKTGAQSSSLVSHKDRGAQILEHS